MKMTSAQWIEYSIERGYALLGNEKIAEIENKFVAGMIANGESLSTIKKESIYPDSFVTFVYVLSKLLTPLLMLYKYIRNKIKK